MHPSQLHPQLERTLELETLLHLLPPLLTAALLLGLVTGGIARALLARLPETPGTATLPP